jgi:Ca2+-transporting ATPase
VVGDIVLLQAGDRVPADCLLIEEMDMSVDEKLYYPDKHDLSVKQCYHGDNINHPNPILLSGSLIMTGNGKAVVLAVGKNTLRETELTKDQLKMDAEETPLMKKLGVLGAIVGKWAYIMAALAFVLFTIFWFCNTLFGDQKLVSNKSL